MLANTSQDDITSILSQPLPGALELVRDGIGTTGSGHVVPFQSCQFFAIFSRRISCKCKDYNGKAMRGHAYSLFRKGRSLLALAMAVSRVQRSEGHGRRAETRQVGRGSR